MIHSSISSIYAYVVDSNNVICGVSQNWADFASANQAPQSCMPESVVGHSLFDFVSDQETRHLYKIMVDKVRATGKSMTIPFRCDAPDQRRYLELEVSPLENQAVRFSSTIVRTEPRPSVRRLEPNQEPSEVMLTLCSMCKKVGITEGQWVEIEEAIQKLGLFDAPKLPILTHGLCSHCFDRAMTEIADL